MEKTSDNTILRFKLVTFVSIIAFSVSFTFSLTTIYNKFLYMENEIHKLQETVKENDENQTRRLNNKTDRNSVLIKKLQDEVNKQL